MNSSIRSFVCVDFWRSEVGRVVRVAIIAVFGGIVLPLSLMVIVQGFSMWRAQGVLFETQQAQARALNTHIDNMLGHEGTVSVLQSIQSKNRDNAANIEVLKQVHAKYEADIRNHFVTLDLRIDRLRRVAQSLEQYPLQRFNYQYQGGSQ